MLLAIPAVAAPFLHLHNALFPLHCLPCLCCSCRRTLLLTLMTSPSLAFYHSCCCLSLAVTPTDVLSLRNALTTPQTRYYQRKQQPSACNDACERTR